MGEGMSSKEATIGSGEGVAGTVKLPITIPRHSEVPSRGPNHSLLRGMKSVVVIGMIISSVRDIWAVIDATFQAYRGEE